MVETTDAVKVRVKVVFGAAKTNGSQPDLEISVTPDCSILEVKQRVAAAAGGQLTADDLLLSFGPNDRKMGRQFRGDPAVDESQLRLAQYSVLAWLRRFPHWTLSVSLLPATPPPPGVAIQRAAASAEGKDPERAVQDARARGEIPKIADLPAPWGPKPAPTPSADSLHHSGYAPARFPEGSSPLVDAA